MTHCDICLASVIRPFQRTSLCRYNISRALWCDMKRRRFLGLLGSAMVWPHTAAAEERVRRIAVLMQFEVGNPQGQAWFAAFKEGLQKLGWVEGRNLRGDYRWTADISLIRRFAKEVVAAKPDLIVSSSSTATLILKGETRTIPVIFANIVDPVGQGLVASWAKPGGNFTGFVNLEPSVSGKYVELLKTIAPRLARVAIFYNPATAPYYEIYLTPFRAAASTFGIEPIAAPVNNLAELRAFIEEQAQKPNSGLVAMPDPFSTANSKEIAALALRHKLPTIFTALSAPRNGALLAYGNDIADNYRRSAAYADRILKGEKPADLPVQFPAKFQMVINLKTAKALGLDVPMLFQQLADEVIE